MQHLEGKIRAADGLPLYWQAWKPEGDVKAVVVLAHGLGEHSGRYAHVAGALTAAGYSVYALDHRGHGQSGGPRGHVPDYTSLLDDFGLIIKMAQRENPGKKVFIYGHSLGGNIVLNYALRRPEGLAGVIAQGAGLKLAFEPPGWKMSLARLMSNIWPSFAQGNELERAALSRDPAVVQAYEEDPLVHDRITARLFVGFMEAAEYALEHAGEIRLPVLLLHGGDDRLTDPAGTRLFYERAGTDDRSLRIYEGLYHEIHNEPEQEQVFRDIIAWLGEHV